MSGTVSGSRNLEVIKDKVLSSRNCVIKLIGQICRSPWS